MTRLAHVPRIAALLLSAALVVTLVAARAGRLAAGPPYVAWVGAAVAVAALAALAVAAARLRHDAHARPARLAECVLFLGLALAAASGLVNWAFGLRGVVVLTEADVVPLANGGHLQELGAGPLARPSDLPGALGLVKVELHPAGGGTFVPESLLDVIGEAGDVRRVTVKPATGAVIGRTSLHQGAFGFAPRLVVQKDGKTVLDRTVPFTTRREGPRGVAFEGEIALPDGAVLVAAVDLEDLNEDMKGHPALLAEVRRGGEVLGQGRLLPGHGATMRDGWHLGYGGMKMWSEIDLARRSPRWPVIAGALLALLGAAAWAYGAVRSRASRRP